MSINKLVSINNVIVNLIDDLGLNHNKYKAMFTNWAVTAEKSIGSFYQYKRKYAVLNITGCTAELPQDAAFLQIAILGDYGCECGDLFNQTCYGLNLNRAFVNGNINLANFLVVDKPSGDTAGYGMVGFHVQDNNLIFDCNRDGQKVTLQYLGLELDCDGIPLVGENHLEAILEYCMWKFRRRNIRSGIDLGLARDHENRWKEYVCRARGDDAELSESDRQRIVDMLHDPYIGRGLQLIPSQGYIYGGLY